MKHILITLLYISLCTVSFAQKNRVTGIVLDAKSNEPVVGAGVIDAISKQISSTDLDGRFIIEVIDGCSYNLSISCLGFEDIEIRGQKTKDLGIILMSPTDYLLSDATVSGQTAVLRKTPVVSSNVYARDIEEKLGNQEFTEALY